jgi:predicted ATPase/class 3 adenylate cyclase
MNFEEVLNQTIEMLIRQRRVSYRAIKRQFGLDDAYLEDLKFEIIEVHKVAIDQDQMILVWTGKPEDSQELTRRTDLRRKPYSKNKNSQFVRYSAEAERRQLTVMFCDLVDSTKLAETLDPEDLREVFRAYQKVCAKAIASAEGYIAQYLGDGVLIYFGYPQAHEDDARRAVSSGLRILETINRLNPRLEEDWGVRLSLRLGIHTGLVIVGEMGVREAPDPMAVVGETPNISARLQSVAEPNTLFISSATYRLVGGFFECASQGWMTLKGISDPMLVYQVLRESKATSRFDVAEASGLTPFVNRIQETELLQRSWEEAKAGNFKVVLLHGEAGMGKSRLLWELKKHIVKEPDVWIAEVKGSPYYQNSAFYPIVEFLQKFLFQFDQHDDSLKKLSKIESFLIQYTLELEEYVPLLAALLSVPFESRYSPLSLSAEKQKQKTIEVLAGILFLIAERQPVLLVLEDLHWMDASTLDAISFLVAEASTQRLMMLLTFRPEFVPPWDAFPNILSLSLRHLSHKETQAIVKDTANGKILPRDVINQIVQKTDGVPLFVEELTKTVLESNLLQEQGTYYELTGASPILAIPTTLHDSLIARLDRLAGVKEIAQLGATLSRKFDYSLIEAVSPWDKTTLQNGLGQLVEAGLLYQQGTLPLASYEFKHALIQDAAYQSLLKGRRQQYHRRIAQVLEGISSASIPTRSELLAHHYSEAGLFEEAIAYWQIAGQRDLEQAANQEAIAHFTRGLELLKKLPESSERDQQELEMQLGLAPAYMAIKGWAAKEVEQASIRARYLSIKLGNSQSLFASLWGLWANYFIRGQMEEALKTANETLQKALSINDPLMYIAGHHAVGYTRFYRGEYRLSRDLAQEGLSKFDLENERILTQTFQLSSTVCLQIILASSWWMMGNMRLADQYIDEALTLAKRLNHLPTHAYVLAASCYHYQPAKNIRWVEEKSAKVIQICREENFLLWLAVGMMYHGWAIAAKGLLKEGLLEAKEGLALFRKTGTSIILPHFMTMLGEMFWLSGRVEEALSSLEEGIREAESRNEHHMEPELYRLKAEILLGKANTSSHVKKQISLIEEAEACLNRAMTLAQDQEAPMLELRAALTLSRHWIACCKQREAYQLLLRVYSQFSEVYPAPEFQESHILLEQLEISINMD